MKKWKDGMDKCKSKGVYRPTEVGRSTGIFRC